MEFDPNPTTFRLLVGRVIHCANSQIAYLDLTVVTHKSVCQCTPFKNISTNEYLAYIQFDNSNLQSEIYPGLLYFLTVALVIASCACLYLVTETNNTNMEDTIECEKKTTNHNATNATASDFEFKTLLVQSNDTHS